MLPKKNKFPIIQIKIAKIKFLNPQTKNKVVHKKIKKSIKKKKLSKPISVKAINKSNFKYALICSQKKIKALVALSKTIIPAIIKNVSKKNAYVISLVKNIAKKKPRSNKLLQVIKNIKIKKLSNSKISKITKYSSN